jgi:hypothetical protein
MKWLALLATLLVVGCQNLSDTVADPLANTPQASTPQASAVSAPTVGDLSLKLAPGMDQEQVLTTFKYRPTSTSLTTCGAQTTHPWQCEIWHYSDGSNSLDILFIGSGETWLVNSWSTY